MVVIESSSIRCTLEFAVDGWPRTQEDIVLISALLALPTDVVLEHVAVVGRSYLAEVDRYLKDHGLLREAKVPSTRTHGSPSIESGDFPEPATDDDNGSLNGRGVRCGMAHAGCESQGHLHPKWAS